MQPGYRPTAGERWSVNLPAVIGVAFVLLVGVVVWVITSADDQPGAAPAPADAVTTATSATSASDGATAPPTSLAAATGVDASDVPVSTSPTPLPSTSAVAGSAASTSAPPPSTTSPGPPTTAPGATDGAVPGDLAVPGTPMQRPPCEDVFITVLASAIGPQATGESVGAVLDRYPGSNYLRTDQTCRSLRSDVDGQPIYVVYLGPFAVESDACLARAEGPDDAYARRLSDEVGPDHAVNCT